MTSINIHNVQVQKDNKQCITRLNRPMKKRLQMGIYLKS